MQAKSYHQQQRVCFNNLYEAHSSRKGVIVAFRERCREDMGEGIGRCRKYRRECEMRGTKSLNLYSTPQNSFLYTSFLLLGLFKKVEI